MLVRLFVSLLTHVIDEVSELICYYLTTDQQALYNCPNRDCRKDFTTLAAVMNHLESESCGFIRFENVQRTATDIVSGDRMIRFN